MEELKEMEEVEEVGPFLEGPNDFFFFVGIFRNNRLNKNFF
jgi:hypothetical protein